MGDDQKRQQIIETLISLSIDRGYITSDDIVSTADSIDLPLDDIDRICETLIDNGIIIRDDEDASDRVGNEDLNGYFSVYSKIDYSEVFKRILQIDESLTTYINELKQIIPPRKGEEKQLIYQARRGNNYARNRLVSMFLKTSARIALYFHDKWQFPLADTIQDGNLGLIYAVDKMPLNPQYRFSTYAPFWIRQTMMKNNISFCSAFYLPTHIKNKLYRIIDIDNSHSCNNCGIDVNEYCKELVKEIALTISETTNRVKYLLSLTKPIAFTLLHKYDEYTPITSSLRDMDMLSLDEASSLLFLENQIEDTLRSLKPREQRVIQLRFGLEDGLERTLEEVGIELGVTRERIRQIEAKALRKLRHPSRSKKLRGFINDPEVSKRKKRKSGML